MTTLDGLLESVKPGNPRAFQNLRIIPLMLVKGGDSEVEYLLAAQALEQDLLTVKEIDQSGSVPELQAVSEADVAVLILDGEELIGAKQNRILNTDVLMRPHSKTTIPVSGAVHCHQTEAPPGLFA